ncbi:MAG TPA: phosphoribosylanthranilate isomerase [Chthoniobacterales bacterium]|jgi:phosphoribosylanthranilate isomerase|nr:phosphoribosylanthranilate isomerase [Chthoniobacterales bacterium]
MLRIKICGLTTPQDAVAALQFGTDALGFNFFPGSKRYVGRKTEWIGELPANVEKLAIVVNPTWDEARTIATSAGITALQLHGSESPEFCHRLVEEGIRFEKALPVRGADSLAKLPDFSTRTVLLDSGGAGEFGGSGRTFPWEIARAFVEENPELKVVLAGGLHPENVAEAVAAVRPFGVDVTTGVETAPGRKDYGRLRAFILAARAA